MNGRERLERLAGDLEAYQETPEFQFRMPYWLKIADCGTSGCAIGLMSRQPWAKQEGFCMIKTQSSQVNFAPGPEGSYALGIVAYFFEIDNNVAEWFFIPESYEEAGLFDELNAIDKIEPRHVAERIRKYLEDGSYGPAEP